VNDVDTTAAAEVPASSVQPGQRIRHRDHEFVVARVDARFLGRDEMICFIEHTPARWHAYPAQRDQTVLLLR
jgi:hypothetical protein